MGVEEFAAITIRELSNRMKGASDYNSYIQREEWARARFIATQVWNVQLAPKDRFTPEQLLMLEGDAAKAEESRVERKSTRETFEAACKKFNVTIP